MIQDIINALTQAGLYPTMPIKDIPNSCCPSGHTIVVDFDQMKELFCKGLSDPPKSADALHIAVDGGRPVLTFVEMKDVAKVRQQLSLVQAAGHTPAFRDQMRYLFLTQFEADRKVLDSILLLLDVVTQHSPIADHLTFLLRDCDWQFCFALGCTSREFVRERLMFLGSRYKYHKIGTVDMIPHVNVDEYLSN